MTIREMFKILSVLLALVFVLSACSQVTTDQRKGQHKIHKGSDDDRRGAEDATGSNSDDDDDDDDDDEGGFVTPPSECKNPSADMTIKVGESIQDAVDNNPEGTSFLIKVGLHRHQLVRAKRGQKFYGELNSDCERLTTLSGAMLLDGFRKEGALWVRNLDIEPGQVHGECGDPEWPRCNFPEDLFVDDEPQKHVDNKSKVNSKSWFMDYGGNKLYMGKNPSGRKVELAKTRVAFKPVNDDITIKNFIIEKYAIPAQMGAIGDQYPKAGWHVEFNEIRFNHGAGVQLGSNGKAINNHIHHNGQLGVAAANSKNALYVGNEISYNNFAGFDIGWEAGGSKFSYTDGLVVRGNCFHHNYGIGLWTDIDNQDTTFDGNIIFNNYWMGILHEISFDATIKNNLVGHNGEKNSWLYGANILISTSRNVEVFANYVEVNKNYGNGIGTIWQKRPPHTGVDNYVHDNEIVFLGTHGKNGTATDFAGGSSIFSNNRHNSNTYHVESLDNDYFMWNGQERSFSSLQAGGQEKSGSIDTNNKSIGPWKCTMTR